MNRPNNALERRPDFVVITFGCRYGALIEFGLVRLSSSPELVSYSSRLFSPQRQRIGLGFPMHTFRIVQEYSGWKVQLGCAMSAPCKSQAMAIQQAQRMAEAIRRHGEQVAVIVESPAIDASPPQAAAAARIRAPRLVSRAK